jgi:hypothetical protein
MLPNGSEVSMTTAERGARLRAVPAAAVLLALPSASAHAADPPSPRDTAFRAPIAGHLTVAGQMRAARRSYEQRRVIRVADRLEARVARAADRRPSHPRLRGDAPAELRDRIARLRSELRAWRRRTVSPARRDAPSATQDMRAVPFYARAGATAWPVCGG